jgi:hypothetical protein
VPGAAGGTISYVGRWDYGGTAGLARVNRELDAGYPVIAEVHLKGSRHFVVITGREGSTYHINDPGYGDRTAINARYGSPSSTIRSIRVYHGSHTEPLPEWRFADVAPNHPYYNAIEALAQLEILSGYRLADGSSRFRPDNPLLRAQAAKLLCGVFGLKVEESMEATFVDLGPDNPDDLYPHDYVAAAAEAGIVEGIDLTTFAPWKGVTRAQLVTMVVRAAQSLEAGALEVSPADFTGSLGEFDKDHAENLRIAEYNDLLEGVVGFGPGWSPWAACTRGEVAQALCNLRTKEAFSSPLGSAQVSSRLLAVTP